MEVYSIEAVNKQNQYNQKGTDPSAFSYTHFHTYNPINNKKNEKKEIKTI